MKVANLSAVKNGLSGYVEHVRKGGRVRILVSGIPTADIVPIADAPSDWTPELVALERDGAVRRGTSGAAKELFKPGPNVDGRRMKHILDDEREDRAVAR